MKKITISVLALIMVMSLLCVPVFAAETWGSMSVAANDAEVTVGDEVILTVYLGDCSALEGGVKNYKATVTIPEGLTLVSATVDAGFDAATGMISSTAAVKNNVVTISSLGNVTSSYKGGKIAVAKIVCSADAIGTYNIGFTASLTDSKYATQTPAAEGTTVTVVAPVHYHSFGEWTLTTAPTCTEAGVETRECACGEKETREVAATGHAMNTYGKDENEHWLICDVCQHAGEKEAHEYDYNGVCVCGATKPVEEDPDLDDVPQTGDITSYIVMSFVAFVALAATAVIVLKRKAVK